jgi:DNA segregation ATPase FtsK/SpoIIIE-like protein
MTAQTAGQVWLNRQADRIERTLSSLDLPVRVSGGQVREGGVRYHLTPMGPALVEALEGAGPAVANALGAERVRVAREIGGLAMEVLGEPAADIRLLPLMHAMGQLEPLTAVLGISSEGQPLTLSLEDRSSQHMLVEGAAGSGKSELLRTILLSLALTSRPSQLQVMAIDFSGQQLTCLESLPHGLTEMASEAGFALELLDWLEDEVDRRRRYQVEQPALLLLVDGFERLPEPITERVDELLSKVHNEGPEMAAHIIVAGRELGMLPHGQAVCRAWAEGQPGTFAFKARGQVVKAAVSWLPTLDLSTAVKLAVQQPGAVDRAQLTAILSEAL